MGNNPTFPIIIGENLFDNLSDKVKATQQQLFSNDDLDPSLVHPVTRVSWMMYKNSSKRLMHSYQIYKRDYRPKRSGNMRAVRHDYALLVWRQYYARTSEL
ncbi:MAG: hypothetical protein U1E82_01650 [Nitrosomonas sp.]